ncbi:MAG: hypothetical protein ABEJ06_06275 [Haloarculaceae archaeon]
MADYRGVLGAFPYAFRATDSRLCQSYVLFGGLLSVVVALGFLVSLAGVLANPGGGGSLVVLLALLVVAPLVAPVLFVARRHRTTGSSKTYDFLLALAGYVFVGTLYAGILASMPECFETGGETVCRSPPAGVLAPVVRALYGVPEHLSFLLPLAGAALVYLTHRVASRRLSA